MTKRALLVGIDYIRYPENRLYGCCNDIDNIKNVLITNFNYEENNIKLLRDDKTSGSSGLPIKENILGFLHSLGNITNDDDETFFLISSHGTRINDDKDNAIVPLDFLTHGFITDNDLHENFSKYKGRVILLFDCCFSGTLCELQYSFSLDLNGKLIETTNSDKPINNPNIFMISGCRDNQTSADSYSNILNEAVGAFTNAFITVLKNDNYNADIYDLYVQICKELKNTGFEQIPLLSLSDKNGDFKFISLKKKLQLKKLNDIKDFIDKRKQRKNMIYS